MKRISLLLPTYPSLLLSLVGLSGVSAAVADTTLTFDGIPVGQTHNQRVIPTFGDNAISSGTGVVVNGSGTSDIDLTFGSDGTGQWDYYDDGGSVWRAAQMDNGTVGKPFDITFTPTAASGVSIKTFNLHPYYNTTFYEYTWSILDSNAAELATGSATTLMDGSKVPVEVNFKGELGQGLTLRLIRTGGDGRADSIAIDDLVFGQLPEIPPNPASAIQYPLATTPASPETRFEAVVKDGVKKAVPGTIQVTLDGVIIPVQVTTTGGEHKITYSNAEPLLASGTTHLFVLTFKDNVPTPNSYRTELSATVANYSAITLPAPIVLETFDGATEGELPAGWSTVSYVPGLDLEKNLADLNSASFDGWALLARSRFNESFLSYTAHTPTTDFRRVLTPSENSAVNGKLIKEYGSGNVVFSTSGYRSGPGQYMALFSPDFNLSGKTGIHLSFHSLWEQNQDSMAAVEYSVDEGANWLPITYLLHTPDVKLDENGNTDAVSTFTSPQSDTPHYTDPNSGEERGTKFEDYILAPVSEQLSAYVQARTDDNPREGKRVEFFSLPAADNQAKVRLRFAHAGTDSWYWGIDNVGLYSIASAPRLSAVKKSGKIEITWTGAGDLETASNIAGPWTKVPANQITDRTYRIDPATGGAAQFFLLR